MDFMSYSNLYQANMDPLALLDPDTLMNYTQHTSQTFFQHYASQTKWTDGSMMAYEAREDGSEEIKVTITERIETLGMVSSARWLSLVIIFILMLIMVIRIATLKIAYPRNIMEYNIECLADSLLLIENSKELLECAEKYSMDELKRSALYSRLDWFIDAIGVPRWGIEVVNGNGVQWVERPEGMVMGELAKSVARSLGRGPAVEATSLSS
jgi:hypothetical protein